MKLGGSDAFIVLERCRSDQTVKVGRMGQDDNTGQCCVAGKTIHRGEELADRFLDKFKRRWLRYSAGDPMGLDDNGWPPVYGSSLKSPARPGKTSRCPRWPPVVNGGERIDRPGAFMAADDLSDIKPDNPAFRTNSSAGRAFLPGQDEDERWRWRITRDFGLGGSVFHQRYCAGKRWPATSTPA